MRIGGAVVALLLATLMGCGSRADEARQGYPLAGSMDARVAEASVHLTLHVTNLSEHPVALEFPSAQRYDFLVRREDGESVWSWSATRSFAQVLTVDTLPPGETRRYSADWPHGGRTGNFVAEGHFLADERAIHLAIPLPLDEPAR
ncbi:MAG: BsuPI-related putative proteinase inhibitor [Gemmatimonadota bacterium]